MPRIKRYIRDSLASLLIPVPLLCAPDITHQVDMNLDGTKDMISYHAREHPVVSITNLRRESYDITVCITDGKTKNEQRFDVSDITTAQTTILDGYKKKLNQGLLFDKYPDILITTDKNTYVITFNGTQYKMLEVKTNEVISNRR